MTLNICHIGQRLGVLQCFCPILCRLPSGPATHNRRPGQRVWALTSGSTCCELLHRNIENARYLCTQGRKKTFVIVEHPARQLQGKSSSLSDADVTRHRSSELGTISNITAALCLLFPPPKARQGRKQRRGQAELPFLDSAAREIVEDKPRRHMHPTPTCHHLSGRLLRVARSPVTFLKPLSVAASPLRCRTGLS